jgi:hypothetical protein
MLGVQVRSSRGTVNLIRALYTMSDITTPLPPRSIDLSLVIDVTWISCEWLKGLDLLRKLGVFETTSQSALNASRHGNSSWSSPSSSETILAKGRCAGDCLVLLRRILPRALTSCTYTYEQLPPNPIQRMLAKTYSKLAHHPVPAAAVRTKMSTHSLPTKRCQSCTPTACSTCSGHPSCHIPGTKQPTR